MSRTAGAYANDPGGCRDWPCLHAAKRRAKLRRTAILWSCAWSIPTGKLRKCSNCSQAPGSLIRPRHSRAGNGRPEIPTCWAKRSKLPSRCSIPRWRRNGGSCTRPRFGSTSERTDGKARWYAIVPRDDGTLSAAVTAMRMTDGTDEKPVSLAGKEIAVERLGPTRRRGIGPNRRRARRWRIA